MSNDMGAYRAVKIIKREKFTQQRPFDRELEGVRRFEPISREHPGFVDILQVGQHLGEGYFYYVMEAGDDIRSGQTFDPPHNYRARTLQSDIDQRGRIPVGESIDIGIALADALGYLHTHGLIHRDVKPSNIIFVKGVPKLADVGLVTHIELQSTYVITPYYAPPEGPGQPSADVYGLGKVLYVMLTGNSADKFPDTPANFHELQPDARRQELFEVILKACDLSARRRFQSCSELRDRLLKLTGTGYSIRPSTGNAAPAPHVMLLCQSDDALDRKLSKSLQAELIKQSMHVTLDHKGRTLAESVLDFERNLPRADAIVAIISPGSLQSETLAHEMEFAEAISHKQNGRPKLIAIQFQLTEPMPTSLSSLTDPHLSMRWNGPEDDEGLVMKLAGRIRSGRREAAVAKPLRMEPPRGAVPLESPFYVIRHEDHELQEAVSRGDSIISIKGSRQTGKTSLLARGLEEARKEHARAIFTDFQQFNSANLESLETVYQTLSDSISDQLELKTVCRDSWDGRRKPNVNFERFMVRNVLTKLPASLVWGLDEVDRLFACPFNGDIFGLLRSWHNKRALDPDGPWSKLTLLIAYATEASLFIKDLVQSPFNVGTHLVLEDFTADQVAELNARHGSPLPGNEEVDRLMSIVGGQPFLVRTALHALASGKSDLETFTREADKDQGLFGDHLRRILLCLAQDRELREVVKGIVKGRACPDPMSFVRLRTAGLIRGSSPGDVRLRCRLYETFLGRHLLSQD